ncbi:MAG: VIT1/CCC1 transporter family protein [Pseudomonadota bacterium]
MTANDMHELDSWAEEKRSAYLYRIVSDAESGNPRQILFLELAREADKQAMLWEREVHKLGGAIPEKYRPDLRTRIVAALVKRFGPRALRPVLAAMKVRGMSLYTKSEVIHSTPVSLAAESHRHRGVAGGGNLRAAVFGVNDGLVSNASLILGVAGATADNGIIVLTGVAGLLAGAFSMAAGEYVSVRSQREMYEYQIGLERDELDQYPEEEEAELKLIYVARGMPEAEAGRMASLVLSDPDRALDTLAREELGLNPDELGSPWGAAIFSFFSFAIGGAIPLLPFFFGSGNLALLFAVACTAIALFSVGATLSLYTGRHALSGGLRMFAIGAAAGGATYFIGKLLGVSLG